MARSINGNLMGKASHRTMDEETDWSMYPDGAYWRQGAMWAKAQIYNVYDGCGVDDKIERIMGRFYNDQHSWMDICLKTERMLALISKLRS